MRVQSVTLENYRSCYGAKVDLAEHLTLLVGENDAGKSNIIDALRSSVPPASGRPTLYFDPERDLSYGLEMGTPIEVERTFCDLTPGEEAVFTPALVDGHRRLIHTTLYRTEREQPRRHRISHVVGEARVPDPEPENRERIVHVYLPPLRDAARALDSAEGNRLADVFEAIASPEEIAEFERAANESLSSLATDDVARKVVVGVQGHLSSVTQPVRHRVVDVRHRDQRLRRLARALRLHMAAEGMTPADLVGSGLGYANLLFIATVVLELERAQEYDLMILLVEEPEAHLHPQLQSVLLSYLHEQAVESSTPIDPGAPQPAGRIQVIATTHSPHLASAVSTNNIVIVRSVDRPDEPASDEEEADAVVHAVDDSPKTGGVSDDQPPRPLRRTETVAAALGSVPLSEIDRRKIDRYLDATRAALLFARQIVLVEGIAEVLLLRTFAEKVVFPETSDGDDDDGKKNRRMREQFRAITVLPIDGIDFAPYLRLLLPDSLPLAERVVIVTDGDDGAGLRRREQIDAGFTQHCASGCLQVFVGGSTLEAELYSSITNEELLRTAFASQHPRSLEKWDAISEGAKSPEERAARFSKALKNKSLALGKGDFAQVIAGLLESSDNPAQFAVPEYLVQAIHAATVE